MLGCVSVQTVLTSRNFVIHRVDWDHHAHTASNHISNNFFNSNLWINEIAQKTAAAYCCISCQPVPGPDLRFLILDSTAKQLEPIFIPQQAREQYNNFQFKWTPKILPSLKAISHRKQQLYITRTEIRVFHHQTLWVYSSRLVHQCHSVPQPLNLLLDSALQLLLVSELSTPENRWYYR